VSTITIGFPAASREATMEDRVGWLESRVASLTDRVATLEQRLALIDDRAAASAPPAATARIRNQAPPIASLEKTYFQQLPGLAGRTLVVLGGAYLLRALTELQLVPPAAGVGLGILYGAPWLLLASRAAARGAELDAFAHAMTAALIGYPLVWEATLRFTVVSPSQSAVLLALLTATALLLSWARSLQGLAWIVSVGTLISAVGLAIATGNWTVYTLLAIAVGLATLWLGYTRNWTLLRWPAAAAANTMLLILTARAAVNGDVREALVVQMVMLGGYLGSFAIRTLLIGRPVIPFEVAQSVAVLAVAYGGAIALIRSTGSNVALVGVASLVLAAAAYVVAFAFVDRHRHVKNFFFYTLLAQLFAVVGIALGTGHGIAPVVYSLAAFVAAVLARHKGRLVLSLQATVYAIAATLASGLAVRAVLALWISPTIDWAISFAQILALSAIGCVTVLRVRRPVESWGISASVLRLVLMVVLVSSAAGTAVALSLRAVPGEPIGGPLLATIRTAALVIATLTLALAARAPGGREATWLVYPLLLLTGAKVVLVDFPGGHPETLFAALALYGVALILAPRLLRGAPRMTATATAFRRMTSDAAATPTGAAMAGEALNK
jgi:hypothetical protein